MTLLFSANSAWSMYIFRGDVLKALIKNGHTIYVAVPEDPYYIPLLLKIGCKIIPISIDAKGSNPIKDIYLFFQYQRIFKYKPIDFAFFYTIKPNIYGSLAARQKKIPHITVVSGLGYTFINNNFISKVSHMLYRFALTSPKEIWFLNEDDKNVFLQKKLASESHTKVIPGEGINLDYYSPNFTDSTINSTQKNDSNKPFTFLLIARMLYDKGVLEFVEAAKIIQKDYPQTRFQLLGALDAENPSAIPQNIVLGWHNKKIIEYLGTTTDVRPIISQADCVVLPSYREGIPRTLMEAAAMEKPLIATNVSGCRDVIDDGLTGFLCESKNPVDLAQKMKNMLQLSLHERVLMGKNGRLKMSKEFDVHIIIKKYFEAIKKGN